MSLSGRFQAIAPELARTALGKQALQASPWQFIPAATVKLAQTNLPAALADELRLTLAVSLARLGLRTTGLEALSTCKSALAAEVAQILHALPDDALPTPERIATCRANLEATRAGDRNRLLGSLDAWATKQVNIRAFRAEGNTVLQHVDGRWLLFLDDAAIAGTVDGGVTKGAPAYVDGFHLPAVLRKLMQSAMSPPGQVQPRFVLLAGSDDEALSSLSLQPLADILQSTYTEVWSGPECPQRVRNEAESRIECAIGPAIGLPNIPESWPRWPRGVIGEQLAHASSLQDQLTTQTKARIESWNASVNAHERFAIAAERRWQGLRVFLPMTRFSTYVQHAAADLARAFERLGCETFVLREPDEHSFFKPLAVLRAVDNFRPDLVVFINTLRSQIPESAPSSIPAVTWVQDAMTHLFTERSGRSMGDRDFVVGHLHPDLFETFCFPRARTMSSSVLASDEKFHDAPVDPSLRERFACEVAYVSHQSHTPEEFAASITADDPDGSVLSAATYHALPLVVDCIHRATLAGPSIAGELRNIADLALKHANQLTSQGSPTSAASAAFLHQVVLPLAERALRQQMISWAADLCERKRWRLHLYGKGWERSRFARYARGELPHGEALRAAYQCARTHLHVGMGGTHHQRVLECALSGGCTLVRIKSEDARLLEWWAQNELTRCAPPDQFTPHTIFNQTFHLTPVADHWQAMMAHAAMDRLGVPQQHPHRGMQAVSQAQLRDAPRREPTPLEAAWLMGDPAETAFWSPESFERAVTALVESDRRRTSFAAWQRRAAKQHFSLDAFAARILELVSNSLKPVHAVTSATRISG